MVIITGVASEDDELSPSRLIFILNEMSEHISFEDKSSTLSFTEQQVLQQPTIPQKEVCLESVCENFASGWICS